MSDHNPTGDSLIPPVPPVPTQTGYGDVVADPTQAAADHIHPHPHPGGDPVGYLDLTGRVWCLECASLPSMGFRRYTALLPPHPELPGGSDNDEVCEGCRKEFRHGGQAATPRLVESDQMGVFMPVGQEMVSPGPGSAVAPVAVVTPASVVVPPTPGVEPSPTMVVVQPVPVSEPLLSPPRTQKG